MGRVDPEKRASATARLRQLADTGHLTSRHVRLTADGCGVSERTVWRWIDAKTREADGRERPGYQLTETDREAYTFYRGNAAAVYRARRAVVEGSIPPAGVPVPDFLTQGWQGAQPVAERTLRRAFADQVPPAETAVLRSGENARRDADVYLSRPPSSRNQVWEMDHKQIPVLVMPPRGAAVRPWMTTIIDDATRALVGWAIALTPHSGTVLTAIRMGLVEDAERGPFGAVPALVRIDRSLEFAARPVTDALKALGVDVHRLPAYTPHRKGKVERFHRTLEQMLLSTLPGFTGGPRDAAGRLHGPLDDRPAARAAAETADVRPMGIDALVERVQGWVGWYNTAHQHSALGRRAPAQAWEADPTPLARISPERLRHLLLAEEERVVGKDGIRWDRMSYLAPELQGRRGQRVQIRYMPHDNRSIEVYASGEYLCTAYPQTHLTPEQVEEFRQAQREETRRLRAAQRRSARRSRTELAPMTGSAPAAESRLLPAVDGDDLARRRSERRLAERSSTSLLGLVDPTIHPVVEENEER
ncbi:Mu transposase C-terminal domain-containing protein [Nocardiopsis ganjiahuensis]|uniref:Mu transposase C-terminal domain-containing protein n=1 Tax=Nocardiopsis ganjiahuensis TaxID=239984 RepID=UPI000346EB46|nr:Mu transposase C-terminal domain-containing protein [Nocardiopsis ganjiahuensis]